MNFEQLRAFEAVARFEHFTDAADELFMAQPTLSRQVAALETNLGATLFHRGRGGAVLTTEGEALLPIARRMLADADEARRQMDDFAGVRRGLVRLGAPPTLCVSVVADVLAVFRKQHPGVQLQIMEAGSQALVNALAEGALDLAFTITRPNVPDNPLVVSTPLFTEALLVAAAVGTPLTDPMTLPELAKLPLVAFNRNYDLRRATDAVFAAAGVEPDIAVEGSEMDAVLRFVERGIGVAIVPATVLASRPLLQGAQLLDPAMVRTANLSRRRNVAQSAAVAAMESIIVDAVCDIRGATAE